MTCLPPTYPYLDLPHASVFCLGPLLFILYSAGIPTLPQSTQPLCIFLPMMSRPMSMVILLSSVLSLRSSHRHDIFLPFALIGPILRNLLPALLCYTILSAHLSSSFSRLKSYLLPVAELTESASAWHMLSQPL